MKTRIAAGVAIAMLLIGVAAWRWRSVIGSQDEATSIEDGSQSSIPAFSPPPIATRVAELPFATGTVVDESGVPLAGVAVVASRLFSVENHGQTNWCQFPLQSDQLESDRLATTAGDGSFVVDDVPSDLASLVFVKSGYAMDEWFDLSPQREQNQDRRIVLARGTEITGRVVDREGRPIANAEVRAHSSSNRRGERVASVAAGAPTHGAENDWIDRRESVDDEGRFRLEWLPEREHRLSVSCMGYDFWGKLTREFDPRKPIEITLERTSVILDVIDADSREPIDSACMLVGRAKDARHFELVVPWSDWTPPNRGCRPSPPGRLIFWQGYWHQLFPPPRREQQGVALLSIFAPGHAPRDLEIEVELAQRFEPPHLVVELQPARNTPAISGRVFGADTAHVELSFRPFGSRRATAPALKSVDVGRGGAFTFRDLPRSSYLLTVTSPGFAPRRFEIDGFPIDGHSLDEVLQFELVASATLEVLVVNGAGEPQPGVPVQARTALDACAWVAVSDANGIALLTELPDEPLRIGAFPGGPLGLLAEPVYHLRFHEDILELTPVAGERRRVELRVPEPIEVVIRTTRRDGTPVADVQLEWQGVDHDFSMGLGGDRDRLRGHVLETDERGEAKFTALPGIHYFRVTNGVQRLDLSASVRRNGPRTIALLIPDHTGLGTIHGLLTELGSDVAVTGRPVHAIPILEDGTEGRSRSTFTGPSGRFVFEDVPEGTVRLIACDDSEDSGSSAVSRPYRRAVRTVEVVSGETVEVVVEAAREGEPPPGTASILLDIEVLDDATEEPLAGVEVIVVGIDCDAEYDLGSFTTDSTGKASASVVATEHYRWFVSPSERSGDAVPPEYLPRHLNVLPMDGIATATIRLRHAD